MKAFLYWIMFILCVIVTVVGVFILIAYLRASGNKEDRKLFRNGFLIMLVLDYFLMIGLSATNPFQSGQSEHTKSSKVTKQKSSKDDSADTDNKSPNIPGKKLNKDAVKSVSGRSYYVNKDNHKIRYFVDDVDNEITAVKVVFTPDYGNTVTVQDYLSEWILNDEHLKYTNSKKSEDNTLLDNDGTYNVFSPKNDKWYNFSMQASDDGDNAVSEFSVWPGKNPDAH